MGTRYGVRAALARGGRPREEAGIRVRDVGPRLRSTWMCPTVPLTDVLGAVLRTVSVCSVVLIVGR